MFVFVYGTLKRDKKNHYVLNCRGSKYIGEAITVQQYNLYKGKHFPMLFEGTEGFAKNIVGEVFEITDDILSMLDVFEGHPELFTRKTIKVLCDGEVDVECYFYNHPKEMPNTETISEY